MGGLTIYDKHYSSLYEVSLISESASDLGLVSKGKNLLQSLSNSTKLGVTELYCKVLQPSKSATIQICFYAH